MKAAELLRLYEAGKRDFRGENLRGQIFIGKDLSDIDLSGANLSEADFSGANLSGANLNAVQALMANFERAILTGALIEEWDIGRGTNLDGIKCDYIFCRWDPDTGEPIDRLPADSNSIFAPGEFVQCFQNLAVTSQLEKNLDACLAAIDVIGKRIMGDLWRTFYLSIQDAIALGLLLQVPGLIGKWIIGRSFSGFDVCLQENGWSVNRYACFIIVMSDFLLWIVLAGRILGRFIVDCRNLMPSKAKR